MQSRHQGSPSSGGRQDLDLLQQYFRDPKKQHIAVHQQQPIGPQIRRENQKPSWPADLTAGTTRHRGYPASISSAVASASMRPIRRARRKVRSQRSPAPLTQRPVIVNAERIPPPGKPVKIVQGPDQIQPVRLRRQRVNLAGQVVQSFHRRSSQDLRSYDVAIPRHPQTMPELLVQTQPDGSGRQPHTVSGTRSQKRSNNEIIELQQKAAGF